MKRRLAARLAGLVPLFLGISFMTFLVVRLAPGDPAAVVSELNPKVSLESRAKIRELYGLDRPLLEQYGAWVGRMVRLDFGNSFRDGEPVLRKIAKRIPVTLGLNVLTLGLILLIGIPLGVAGAAARGRWFDRLSTVFVYVGFAMPTFWLALLLMGFFAVKLHVLPVSGLNSIEYEYLSWGEKLADRARHLALPVFVAAFTGIAGISRYMRESVLEALRQDYIRTAWSKGLSRGAVLYRHAVRNALLPVVTLLGLSVPGLLGGSVIFESIFSISGIGRLFFDAVAARDYPVVMGLLMVGAFLTLLGNLLADLAYSFADPRIRLHREV